MVKVSIIIPTWNGSKLLAVSLESLAKQAYKDFEVIVVDNGSTDNTKKLVDKYKHKFIGLDKNYGFAKAVNDGIKLSNSEYVFLLNNDTKLDPNCLFELVKSIKKDPKVGMVAAKMLNFYSPHLVDSAGDYIDAVGHANNRGLDEDKNNYNQEEEVFLVSGGGSLIKKKVFDKVGLLDEDYFAYFEDVDFCFRAQLMGIKAIYCPKAIIYHIHKATSRKNPGFTEYLQYRNMTQTIIKDFPMGLLKKDFNWLKIILVNLNTIRYLYTQGFLKQAILAELYILRNLIKLLRKRHHIQSQRKVTDEYIISWVRPKKVTFFGLYPKGI